MSRERLDVVVAGRTGLSRAAAARLIDSGAVTVDGRPRPKSHRVEPGERVEIEAAPVPATDAPPARFEVVHEDDWLLVVDKPAGVAVHPGAGHAEGTLAQALRGRAAGGPDPSRAGIVHRLDKDTSGLMVVARSEEVHRRLQAMIRAREVRREYLALVEGRPDAESGTIDAPLGRDRVRRDVVSTRSDRARPAVTHFWQVQALPRTTLLGVRLETGRTHQIRAHLAAIGHPVCGDGRYGGEPCGRRLGLTRQFLHARLLVFRHPASGEELACESKPPVDLRQALDAATREPVSGGPDGD
jgi:23S rRNA pseudouridine1911/1915/1917 synthase